MSANTRFGGADAFLHRGPELREAAYRRLRQQHRADEGGELVELEPAGHALDSPHREWQQPWRDRRRSRPPAPRRLALSSPGSSGAARFPMRSSARATAWFSSPYAFTTRRPSSISESAVASSPVSTMPLTEAFCVVRPSARVTQAMIGSVKHRDRRQAPVLVEHDRAEKDERQAFLGDAGNAPDDGVAQQRRRRREGWR